MESALKFWSETSGLQKDGTVFEEEAIWAPHPFASLAAANSIEFRKLNKLEPVKCHDVSESWNGLSPSKDKITWFEVEVEQDGGQMWHHFFHSIPSSSGTTWTIHDFGMNGLMKPRVFRVTSEWWKMLDSVRAEETKYEPLMSLSEVACEDPSAPLLDRRSMMFSMLFQRTFADWDAHAAETLFHIKDIRTRA